MRVPIDDSTIISILLVKDGRFVIKTEIKHSNGKSKQEIKYLRGERGRRRTHTRGGVHAGMEFNYSTIQLPILLPIPERDSVVAFLFSFFFYLFRRTIGGKRNEKKNSNTRLKQSWELNFSRPPGTPKRENTHIYGVYS